MITIPEDLSEFLYWVKERTEAFWNGPDEQLKAYYGGNLWMKGARWAGMTDEQINAAETRYNIRFSEDHRAFLRVLHTIDRKEVVVYEEELPDGSYHQESYETPFFYNWLTDDEDLADQFDFPRRTILRDVLGANKVWLRSWGARPFQWREKLKRFDEWYAKAPKLIPLKGNRFALQQDNWLTEYPILSVWGSDTIVFGWSIRTYLLREICQPILPLHQVWDEEDRRYASKNIPEVQSIFDQEYLSASSRDIPYWKELILIWSSGYSSFGLKSPTYGETGPYPITKTWEPGEEEPGRQYP